MGGRFADVLAETALAEEPKKTQLLENIVVIATS
jgi:hypothetical protein